MNKFKEMLMKKAKEGKFVKPDEAKRKMELLDEIDEMMGSEMGDKLQKVVVSAKDAEGLKEGLQLAEEKVDEIEDMSEKMEDAEMDEDAEEVEEDPEEMSEEEIKAKIAELEAILAKKEEKPEEEDSEEE